MSLAFIQPSESYTNMYIQSNSHKGVPELMDKANHALDMSINMKHSVDDTQLMLTCKQGVSASQGFYAIEIHCIYLIARSLTLGHSAS